MQVDHHDLHQEFPDMADAIDALKASNAYFARLIGSYNRLTGKVEDLEEHDMPVADFTLEDMKKQRVKLKDELYHLLLAFRAGQASVAK
ncbi:YdcH family protein [Azonexus sp.]|uniref:YdcH family protein n=1 Tax=Azonexus sp. TaxID=1872668 RepID=UPI0035B41BAD